MARRSWSWNRIPVAVATASHWFASFSISGELIFSWRHRQPITLDIWAEGCVWGLAASAFAVAAGHLGRRVRDSHRKNLREHRISVSNEGRRQLPHMQDGVPNRGCPGVDSTRAGRSAGGFRQRQSRVRWRRMRGQREQMGRNCNPRTACGYSGRCGDLGVLYSAIGRNRGHFAAAGDCEQRPCGEGRNSMVAGGVGRSGAVGGYRRPSNYSWRVRASFVLNVCEGITFGVDETGALL